MRPPSSNVRPLRRNYWKTSKKKSTTGKSCNREVDARTHADTRARMQPVMAEQLLAQTFFPSSSSSSSPALCVASTLQDK